MLWNFLEAKLVKLLDSCTSKELEVHWIIHLQRLTNELPKVLSIKEKKLVTKSHIHDEYAPLLNQYNAKSI